MGLSLTLTKSKRILEDFRTQDRVHIIPQPNFYDPTYNTSVEMLIGAIIIVACRAASASEVIITPSFE